MEHYEFIEIFDTELNANVSIHKTNILLVKKTNDKTVELEIKPTTKNKGRILSDEFYDGFLKRIGTLKKQ
jgi:hypothetical protein